MTVHPIYPMVQARKFSSCDTRLNDFYLISTDVIWKYNTKYDIISDLFIFYYLFIFNMRLACKKKPDDRSSSNLIACTRHKAGHRWLKIAVIQHVRDTEKITAIPHPRYGGIFFVQSAIAAVRWPQLIDNHFQPNFKFVLLSWALHPAPPAVAGLTGIE